MKAARVVVVAAIVLHVPLAVLTVLAIAEEPLFMIVTGPAVAAAAIATAGLRTARRRPRRGALLVLGPGLASVAWFAFLGMSQPEVWPFLVGVPLLPLGGFLMLRQAGGDSPLPALPARP